MDKETQRRFMRQAAMVISMAETEKVQISLNKVNRILNNIDCLLGLSESNNDLLDWRETFIAARHSVRNNKRLKSQLES